MTRVVQLKDGTKGFDCNQPISLETGKAFAKAGYRFAVRYVRRQQHHDYDLTALEVSAIMSAGLALMPVQHVAPPGWIPTDDDGAIDGRIAAREAQHVGIPPGVVLWCDLEGVKEGTPSGQTIGFCNNWFDAVAGAGYYPGLYVGDSCGLTAGQLYRNLRFPRYWAAYNLNSDQYPLVRGVQMQQRVASSSDRHGVPRTVAFQVDFIRADRLGSTPAVMML